MSVRFTQHLALGALLIFAGCGGVVSDDAAADSSSDLSSSVARFQQGVAPTASYAGAEDTTLSQSAPSTVEGGEDHFSVDGDNPNTTRLDNNLLLKFDVSTIPAGSTVTAVSLVLNVLNASVQTYPLYPMNRSWVEAQATWNSAGNGQAWGAAGAQATADRGTTDIGTLTATKVGATSVALNPAGIALVQRWVNEPKANFGVTSSATDNYDMAAFSSSEASNPAFRPALAVTFTRPVASECFPFADPSVGTLRASAHKAFAHYFSPYTLSLMNEDPSRDYYVLLGSDTFSPLYGGLLRDRPLPQAPRLESNWETLNLQEEVRRAIALGLDGFTYDMLNLTPGTHHWNTLIYLLNAAHAVDPNFKIVLMPDMNATWATNRPENLVTAVQTVSAYPALYRDAAGAIVIWPFNTQKQTPQWWKTQLALLADKGIKTSLVAMNLNVAPNNYAFVNDYAPISNGISEWGAAFASASAGMGTHASYVQGKGKLYAYPVTPQSFRPNQSAYWEASNSQTLQKNLQAAISSNADWIQFVTWNDYSEGTQISPSVATGWAFYDLSAYYLRWFKLGTAPAITRDALYYFHRKSLTTLQATRQTGMFRVPAGPTPTDNVELVAFLTAPGTLEIRQGSEVKQQVVAAGLQTFTVPLHAGSTPAFRLLRNGAQVVQLTSNTPVLTQLSYQDLLYHAGTSVSCDRIMR